MFGNYKEVAARLGLTFGDDYRITGMLEGFAVTMWFGAHSVHTAAMLARPAPVELSLASRGVISKLADLFTGHDHDLGDPELDKEFALKTTADKAKVAALFSPAARAALLDAAKSGYHPAVDAHSIHIRHFSQGSDFDTVEAIELDFKRVVALAKAISFAATT